MKLAAIRLKGSIEIRKDIGDTMEILGLKRKLSMAVLPNNNTTIGMLKKSQNFVAWGELSEELEEQLKDKKRYNLRPPKGGFKSLKQMYPKGDLGYRGDKINELIKKMIS